MTNYTHTATVGADKYGLDEKGRIVLIDHHMTLRTGADEKAFNDYIAEEIVHQQQLASLTREDIEARPSSMWGRAQGARRYARGVVLVHTAGHGGFILCPTLNEKVHPSWRNDRGMYEEDAHWCVVAITFPEIFTDKEKRMAHATAKSSWPDEYTQATGIAVAENESRTLQERAAAERNKGKWIVISAMGDGDMVRCLAKIDGRSSPDGESRIYHVPRDEYHIPVGGFVIDEGRHTHLAGEGFHKPLAA